MKKNIVILGSTGSIGASALEVIGTALKNYRVLGLSANENTRALKLQIKKYRPKYAVVMDPYKAKDLRGIKGTRILTGIEGLVKMASLRAADVVLLSVVGAAGILPLLAAVRAGKKIALANKESLVIAGDIVNRELKKYGAELVPVDSEHNAVFQALRGNKIKDVKKLIITASGGPFKDLSGAKLKKITVGQALRHPTWKMGKKITIDSATLLNKGLEVIEAHYLYGIPYDKIQVIIHPQSIVHSMVEYIDGSVIAQMSNPDMRLPIMYALTCPDRAHGVVAPLDLEKTGRLEFFPVDFGKFPAFSLALAAGRAGGTMPACMNAANEIAVKNFIKGRIKFDKIPYYISRAMKAHKRVADPDLNGILEADREAREFVEGLINSEHGTRKWE
jgi:1-deoxy-D-xylulose-5-phosphate reductoisomerase